VINGACFAALFSGCGPAPVEPVLEVWPGSINLGITADGEKFKGPVGASGGTGLQYSVEKTEKPRISIRGTDDGAILTAEFAGADQLIVTAADGQTVSTPVNVVHYDLGAVARGRSAVMRIGCQMSGCHDDSGPDFTPSRIVGFDDRDISNWILNGKSLKTGVTVPGHAWPISIEEEAAVVAYLRSLPARGAALR
jgi:hypothetical protein